MFLTRWWELPRRGVRLSRRPVAAVVVLALCSVLLWTAVICKSQLQLFDSRAAPHNRRAAAGGGDCVGCGPWDAPAAAAVRQLPGWRVYRQLAQLLDPQRVANVSRRCVRLLLLGGKVTQSARDEDVDGRKPVCLDPDLLQLSADSSCLLYTVGVRDDPSFEKAMAQFGCEVHAFDPTIAAPAAGSLPPGLHVHLIGMDGRTWMHRTFSEQEQPTAPGAASLQSEQHEWPLMTLDDLRQLLGHTERRISYLKLDAEGSEWLLLRQQLALPTGGALADIPQLNIELHLMFPNGRLTPPGVDDSWQHQVVEEDARLFLRALVALQEAGYELIWSKSFGRFPGIGLAHVYETLFVRRDLVLKSGQLSNLPAKR